MNLLRALATVSSMTLLSRVLGFIRDAIIARVFGAGILTDAFFVAFRLPNLLRRMFAEGAFSQAFVPLLAGTRATEGDVVTQRLIDAVATVLLWALVVTSLIGVVGAPVLVWLLGSGLPLRRPRTSPAPTVLSARAPGEPGPAWWRWWG